MQRTLRLFPVFLPLAMGRVGVTSYLLISGPFRMAVRVSCLLDLVRPTLLLASSSLVRFLVNGNNREANN